MLSRNNGVNWPFKRFKCGKRYLTPDLYNNTSKSMLDGLLSLLGAYKSNSRSKANGAQALYSGGLGAFIGFFAQSFREHDYQLGRRNCQQFLKEHFVVDKANPIFNDGNQLPATTGRRPIIPLLGSLKDDIRKPDFLRLDPNKILPIKNMIKSRTEKVIEEDPIKGLGGWVKRKIIVSFTRKTLSCCLTKMAWVKVIEAIDAHNLKV